MYDIPSDESIESCVITKASVEKQDKPVITHRDAKAEKGEKKSAEKKVKIERKHA